MKFSTLNECVHTITDDDIVAAMKQIPGYLDITPSDFLAVYRVAYDHALHRLKHAVTAGRIMTRDVVCVHDTDPVTDVVRRLADHDISGVPVIRQDRTVAGVISEKDVLSRLEKTGTRLSFMQVMLQCLEHTGCLAAGLEGLTAADIMSAPAVTLTASTPLFEIADIMDQRNINRIPVVDDTGRLTGIVARSDLIQTIC